MEDNVARLELAQPPGVGELLRVLDLLRGEVERGEIMAMVVISIRAEQTFDVTSSGDIHLATLAGMLGRAHLDALEAMRR